jgi:hypothetical protein
VDVNAEKNVSGIIHPKTGLSNGKKRKGDFFLKKRIKMKNPA